MMEGTRMTDQELRKILTGYKVTEKMLDELDKELKTILHITDDVKLNDTQKSGNKKS